MVTVNNLTVKIDAQTVINSISMQCNTGTITTLIGNSGAGKTTLLKSIAGLIPTTDGTITVDEQQLNRLSPQKRAEYVGYLFQEFNLFIHLTVLENCIDPLLVHGISYQDSYARAITLLKELGMIDCKDRYPSQLSGGQQQRAAIARALCLNPKFLLLDEPTASLDPLNTDILVNVLKSLAQKGFTIILSTQDMSFVKKIADRIYFMQAGRLIETCESISAVDNAPQIKAWLSNG